MKSLSLDASVNNLGWSTFDSKKRTQNSAWKWGTIHPEGGNLEWRIKDAIEQLDDIFGLDSIDYLVTERPAFYSSERGQIAVHMNYTIDLAAINYFIAGWMRMDHRHHAAITASRWKGSVTKNITARKFFHRFPKVKANQISEHAIDAVMLHRYWLEEYAIRLRPYVADTPPERLLELLSISHMQHA